MQCVAHQDEITGQQSILKAWGCTAALDIMLLWRVHCVAAKETIIRKSYQSPGALVFHRHPVGPTQHAFVRPHHTQKGLRKRTFFFFFW